MRCGPSRDRTAADRPDRRRTLPRVEHGTSLRRGLSRKSPPMISGEPPGPPWSGESLPGKGPDRREPQAVDCVRMVHCSRRFYEIHQATSSPLAAEALRRIRDLYAIEAEIRGRPAEVQRATRQERSKPVVDALHAWLIAQLGRVSGRSTL